MFMKPITWLVNEYLFKINGSENGTNILENGWLMIVGSLQGVWNGSSVLVTGLFNESWFI